MFQLNLYTKHKDQEGNELYISSNVVIEMRSVEEVISFIKEYADGYSGSWRFYPAGKGHIAMELRTQDKNGNSLALFAEVQSEENIDPIEKALS